MASLWYFTWSCLLWWIFKELGGIYWFVILGLCIQSSIFSFSVVWEDVLYNYYFTVFLPNFLFLSKKMFFMLCLLSSIVYYSTSLHKIRLCFKTFASAGTSWDFVLMGLIADIGMQNLLVLHLLLKRSFRRSNIYIPTIIIHLTNFSNKGVLAIPNKLKNPSFLKELIPQTKGWLENHYQQSQEMPSHSNKFNSLSSRSARAKYKMLLMASLIKPVDLLPLYLKEYLGVFRVL